MFAERSLGTLDLSRARAEQVTEPQAGQKNLLVALTLSALIKAAAARKGKPVSAQEIWYVE